MKLYDEFIYHIEHGNIRTDSDIEIFAEKHLVDYNVVYKMLADYKYGCTPCGGCKHIVNRLYPSDLSSPCSKCSRSNFVTDMYEKENIPLF